MSKTTKLRVTDFLTALAWSIMVSILTSQVMMTVVYNWIDIHSRIHIGLKYPGIQWELCRSFCNNL